MTSRLSVSPDGEWVEVHVECGPMAPPHVVKFPFPEVWDAALQARSRQLGTDSKGGL